MPAVLFGSISTLADTSELQRDAFNRAFATHGLDWRWEGDEYRAMLEGNGGRDRIAQYATDRGEDVDADAVHATKSEVFQQSLGQGGVHARPGVADIIRMAKQRGDKVALVTTTSPGNVSALLDALADEIDRDAFDLVVDNTQVEQPKPDPSAYALALDRLGVTAAEAVAIEDNVGGVRSAQAAGVAVLGYPNQNTAGHDFGDADDTAAPDETVDVERVDALAGAR